MNSLSVNFNYTQWWNLIFIFKLMFFSVSASILYISEKYYSSHFTFTSLRSALDKHTGLYDLTPVFLLCNRDVDEAKL